MELWDEPVFRALVRSWEDCLFTLDRDEVITWKEGTFAFFHNLRPKDEEILMDLRMDYLLLEGLRRMDESNLLVPV